MMNFDQAQRRHGVVRRISAALVKFGRADGGREFWDAATGIGQAQPGLPTALRLHQPADAIPLVRALSAVAASFAFACVAEAIVEVSQMVKAGQPAPSDDEVAMRVWERFDERRKIAHVFESGLGFSHDPSWETAIDLAQHAPQDIAKVTEIVEMAGRMFETLDGFDVMTVEGDGEVAGVTLGDDISKMISSEIAQLLTPGLDDPAAVRMLDKQALEYQQQKTVPASKGPLVFVTDESGSMGSDRLAWSKACVAAMARIAHTSNRMVRVVHFGTATAITEMAPGNHVAYLDMMRHYLGGGTDIGSALEVAVEQVGDLAAAGFVGADIVLVTDGEDGNTVEINAALDKADAQGIALHTVAIQLDVPARSPIRARAKNYVQVGDTSGSAQSIDAVSMLRDAARSFTLQTPPREPMIN